jgi:hypothetical protein
MTLPEAPKSVSLARSIQSCPCHVCAFFSSKEEEYRVMLPFMCEGYQAGDKLLHILDKDEGGERLARLQGAGIDVENAERDGQLELRSWEQAHVLDGRFDMHAMLDLHQHHLAGENSSYRLTRIWSNQEWVLAEGLPGAEDLIEYEARFNYIWPKYENVYVCVYDVRKFSASVMMQLLRTHPFAITNGLMYRNPFYVPPDEFLREIGKSRSGP